MKIVYWSGTGNTEKMANLIAKGIVEKGKEADVVAVSDASSDIFNTEDIVILGCPAMGDEVLEEGEFEPFVEELVSKVSGKKVALFGSYGCVSSLDPLIVSNEPEGDTEEQCIEFGRKIAEL